MLLHGSLTFLVAFQVFSLCSAPLQSTPRDKGRNTKDFLGEMACGVSFTKGSAHRAGLTLRKQRRGKESGVGKAQPAGQLREPQGSWVSPKHTCLLEEFGFGPEGLCSCTLNLPSIDWEQSGKSGLM